MKNCIVGRRIAAGRLGEKLLRMMAEVTRERLSGW
jgi:hypothetical protein